ncbi:hypothetical protein GCM10009612_73990 [Streptomyces beijiangensis]
MKRTYSRATPTWRASHEGCRNEGRTNLRVAEREVSGSHAGAGQRLRLHSGGLSAMLTQAHALVAQVRGPNGELSRGHAVVGWDNLNTHRTAGRWSAAAR